MRQIQIILWAIVTALTLTAPVQAQTESLERIAAVVNDEVITVNDLRNRITLSVVNAGLPDNPEVRQRLAPQVLRALIDEALQLQEAKRLNVSVSDDEVKGAMARIAEQNRMPVEQLEPFLTERGIPVSVMQSQIRASISWAKLSQRRLNPSIQIGDEEIDEVLHRIRANAGKPEYLVSEIFLPVDSSEQEGEIRQVADRLIEQIRKGASFPAVARQFSQSAGAAAGGDLGWVQQGQLPEELDAALQQLGPGRLSPPIRSASGYHILAVRDQRIVMGGDLSEAKVRVTQVFLPFPQVNSKEELRAAMAPQVEAIRTKGTSCDALAAEAKQSSHPLSGDAGEVRVGDLPPEIAKVVTQLPVGELSPPLTNPEGILLLMVCDRQLPAASLPPREQVSNTLAASKMEMLQRRLLRDLRRSAYIDVRV